MYSDGIPRLSLTYHSPCCLVTWLCVLACSTSVSLASGKADKRVCPEIHPIRTVVLKGDPVDFMVVLPKRNGHYTKWSFLFGCADQPVDGGNLTNQIVRHFVKCTTDGVGTYDGILLLEKEDGEPVAVRKASVEVTALPEKKWPVALWSSAITALFAIAVYIIQDRAQHSNIRRRHRNNIVTQILGCVHDISSWSGNRKEMPELLPFFEDMTSDVWKGICVDDPLRGLCADVADIRNKALAGTLEWDKLPLALNELVSKCIPHRFMAKSVAAGLAREVKNGQPMGG